MEEKIDVHSFDRKVKLTLTNLALDSTLDSRNKDLIRQFDRDCALGKTVKKGRKKKLNASSRMRYLIYLVVLARWLNKPFDQVTEEDMEKLIEALENNEHLKKDGGQYAEETKIGIKITIKKFYKWLLAENPEKYQALTGWIDTFCEIKETPALTRTEVEALVDGTGSPMIKAIVMTLFDAGARAAELLNIRMRDVDLPSSSNGSIKVRIRYSKGLSSYRRIRLRVS